LLGIGGSGKAKEGDAGFCGSFKNGAHCIAGKSQNSVFPKTKTHRLRLIQVEAYRLPHLKSRDVGDAPSIEMTTRYAPSLKYNKQNKVQKDKQTAIRENPQAYRL
jgi:hypothetical protein